MGRVRTGGAKRWKDRASMSREAYQTGIQSPRQDWATATKAAKASWQQGIQDAIANGRFEKGITKAGSAKQQARALLVGADRFVEGVGVAEEAYSQGVAPYLQVLENIVLPPRFPKGDPRNLKRVEAVTKALRDKKLQGI